VTSPVRITGLSAMNVRAIRETRAVDLFAEVTSTTATTVHDPADTAIALASIISDLPGRGHPRASLHAVVRRLVAAAAAQHNPPICADPRCGYPSFRGDPAEEDMYHYDDDHGPYPYD